MFQLHLDFPGDKNNIKMAESLILFEEINAEDVIFELIQFYFHSIVDF